MLKQTIKCGSYAEQAVLTPALLTRLSFYGRYQHYSTTFTPHSSERQRERQRGLVKQTFELDVAATENQDDQVANGHLTNCVLSLGFIYLTVLIYRLQGDARNKKIQEFYLIW